MTNISGLIFLILLSSLAASQDQGVPAKPTAPLPALKKSGTVTQLFVDGKPFVMLAGELHNSSASSVEYMKPLWKKLQAFHLNTVIGTVSWELVEPQEGKFDFSLVDYQIREARRHDLRLVLIWFGTWKNAVSSYVPLWVKADLKRFPRIQSKDGVNLEVLTPLGEESMAADAKAFRSLMRHIRMVDPQRTVIMMQVENESGLLGDSRDRSPLAEAVWNQAVPARLMNYLSENKAKMIPETLKVWGAAGYRSSGTWPEVFGTDPYAGEFFMAWHIGSYIGAVAAAGKSELDIPMFANAWLVQNEAQLPGAYPSGGPVSRVLDVWRAAAPALDLLAPDIYIADFEGVCASYTRSGNPLFIPEARASVPNLFWALGRHAALGYSPFGIDGLHEDHPIGAAYQVLAGLMPVLTHYQAEGKVVPIVQEKDGPRTQTVLLDGYKATVDFPGDRRPQPQPDSGSSVPGAPRPAPDERAFGLIISIAPDEFLVVGSRLTVRFATASAGQGIAAIAAIEEGRYEKGLWIPGRRLNGDESGGGTRMQLAAPGIAMQRIHLYRHD